MLPDSQTDMRVLDFSTPFLNILQMSFHDQACQYPCGAMKHLRYHQFTNHSHLTQAEGSEKNGIIHRVTTEVPALPVGSNCRLPRGDGPRCGEVWRSRGSFLAHLKEIQILKPSSFFVFSSFISFLLTPYNVFTTTTSKLRRQPAGSSWLGPPKDSGQEPR